MALPKGFVTAESLLGGEVALGSLVSFVGVVKDCRKPIPTRKADFKMEGTLYDLSTEADGRDIRLTIFRPEEKMPEFNVADVVLVSLVKVQNWSGNPGLITNHQTTIHVFEAARIPRPPASALIALRQLPGDTRPPLKKDTEYVSYLYNTLDKDILPTVEEFQEKTNQSLNVKPKFSTLDKVSDGRFHDLVVQVVKDPWSFGDKVTLWVTDYTTNSTFYNHAWNGGGAAGGDGTRDGDPYGYTSKFRVGAADSSSWPGPFGKMSMQVSCWEPHASFLMSDVKAGAWVFLRNVQIKYGSNGQNLEGFLRGDQNFQRFQNNISVAILESGDRESTDPRVLDALRRKRDYNQTVKKQIRQLSRETSSANETSRPQKEVPQGGRQAHPANPPGTKRKNEDEPVMSKSKRKREKRRAAALRAGKLEEFKNKNRVGPSQPGEPHTPRLNSLDEPTALNLNPLVRCEASQQKSSTLSALLERQYHSFETKAGQTIHVQLPFNNVNYHALVRVVDFHPSHLEDFAVRRRVSEFDLLSDDGIQDSLDDDSDNDAPGHAWEWQWRFSLVLEDASVAIPKGQVPDRVRVMIHHHEGQLLTDLDPADLRADTERLDQLREKMFILWGNLEEIKNRQSSQSAKERLRAGLPPPSSDVHLQGQDSGSGTSKGPGASEELQNLPFTCCIKQYGVKTRTENPDRADAGEGLKWKRAFALFGTRILSES